MRYTRHQNRFRLNLDLQATELHGDDLAELEQILLPLEQWASGAPAELMMSIAPDEKDGGFQVKASLIVNGETLYVAEQTDGINEAVSRCVEQLGEQLRSQSASSDQTPHHQRKPLAADALQTAVRAGDYSAFRKAVSVYEEPIRKKIELWAAEHPEILAQVGGHQPPADVLEEVFVRAFEHYERISHRHPGHWLDESFNAVVESLLHHAGTGKRNIGSTQTDRPQRE